MDDEAGFTKFVSGDTVYARARRLHRATTGRTTKRFVANWALEDYLETMRRTPPPPVTRHVRDAARDLLSRLEKNQFYVHDERDINDLLALGLPRVRSLDELPAHAIDAILARDGSRSDAPHKIALRLSAKLRPLQDERDALRAVGLRNTLLYQVTAHECASLVAMAANDTTDYAAASAIAAKEFMRRIHKSETHGCASFSEYNRWDRRRFHDYGRGKRHAKATWAGDCDDDTAAAADAMQEMHLDTAHESFDAQENAIENGQRDDGDAYDFCNDLPGTNAGASSPQRSS
ncbi:hypothetical protein SPRG_13272 [Saprolegnia parasitica CBS 223.65]|uniref:Uncharacterized protein n=1 Tax=Saprolegnia parasitica (strain CBS 223.65) TaxID=695850 RepID=A0A067C465_SAPPC|nr:hypothetical protein SPRG_13272 [Saprolegnia parasitica CBS 223.65]KDO21587.1 hypothetical protein SPRG_13272 [Saprolegnia parasitica CBS 223.65]|eukprot:XP_012207678.1 hypothetical protein SPRG_13272 [Saprolegnia parasitica CBS 223.65]